MAVRANNMCAWGSLFTCVGLAKVKEMLEDVVNSCYDSTVENRRLRAILSSSVVSLQSLLLALMRPFTHATFGLVSCPSGDVSELLLIPVSG
jgi:hypothetical protein